MDHSYDRYFEPSRPLVAKGGIRAHSRRGGFGQTWWASRWTEILEDFDLGARLSRGRTYARRGQVLTIDVREGMVAARVQGSRSRPYRVKIEVGTLGSSDWEKLSAALLERPVFAAKLLAGQMPENIEDVFRKVGLSLFPERSDDLRTDCSCPDWSNPCKHIAAVYLLLGEEFDRDPFLIFKLRGGEREVLLGLAEREATRSSIGGAQATVDSQAVHAADQSPPEPLPADPAEFWGQDNAESGEDIQGVTNIPKVAAALPKQLGNFPFWRGEEGFIPALEELYRRASRSGMDVFLGERQAPVDSKAGDPDE